MHIFFSKENNVNVNDIPKFTFWYIFHTSESDLIIYFLSHFSQNKNDTNIQFILPASMLFALFQIQKCFKQLQLHYSQQVSNIVSAWYMQWKYQVMNFNNIHHSIYHHFRCMYLYKVWLFLQAYNYN